MNCQRNINSTLPTQLPHKFSYIVPYLATIILNHPIHRLPPHNISLTVHSRAILKIVESMCNGIKKIKCTLMKYHTNINSTPPRHPHSFYINFPTLIHNHFESLNIKHRSSNYQLVDRRNIIYWCTCSL
jgi:hypothetical protein